MKKLTGAILFFCFAMVSFAHFQMIYTPTSIVDGQSEVEFKLVFTHPAESGHTMDIGKTESGEVKGMKEFFVIHKGKKTDLTKDLKKTTFETNESSASSFDFTLTAKQGFRGMGDWALIAVPNPYYEGSEGIYIQQITKVFINKGSAPTDWMERCAEGYPEIIALSCPYNIPAGGIFRGQVVDSNGKPVAGAEIEVEYINYKVDMKKNTLKGKSKFKNESLAAALIFSDENGYFSFVPAKEGYWGFAALGAGSKKEYAGKELSEDAVIWIEAVTAK